MQRSYPLAAVLLFAFCVSPVHGDDNQATVAGSKTVVRFERASSTLLLNAEQAAAAFGWQAKVVAEGKLLTLCRDGDDGVCIPIQLDRVATSGTGDSLYVAADALGRALSFSVVVRDGQVVLQPAAEKPDGGDAPPAYNAQWGAGRGFEVGQTVPDIPLFDMQGREVRFSRYLGKQYILYCWASW